MMMVMMTIITIIAILFVLVVFFSILLTSTDLFLTDIDESLMPHIPNWITCIQGKVIQSINTINKTQLAQI